jgi:hypothetical protein
MKIKVPRKALSLADDFYVGKSSDGTDCMFLFGDGIELRTEHEKELANEVVTAMKSLAKYVTANVKLRG